MRKQNSAADPIFGIIDETLDKLEAAERRKTKRHSALPKLKVRRTQTTPEMDKVDLTNVVYVPENVLKALTKTLNVETSKLNRVLLQQLMPMLLSYQTSTNYAKAAIKEGLDVEVEFDAGLTDCIQHIGYLNVVMHFLRGSRLPVSVKKAFMHKFSEDLAASAITSMLASNKVEQQQADLNKLQAVVYSRQKNRAEVRTREESEDKPRSRDPRQQRAAGIRKSRHG